VGVLNFLVMSRDFSSEMALSNQSEDGEYLSREVSIVFIGK
jgi:hypothetical protein